MKKFFKIVIINISIIVFLLYCTEIVFWLLENIDQKKDVDKSKEYKEYPQDFSLPIPFNRKVRDFEYFRNTYESPRKYEINKKTSKTKRPILIFGCSFAYGLHLKNEQTFAYKLSNITERPIYNEAISGVAMQYMLYLTQSKDFYKKIPEPEHVIYVFMDDHFRRIMSCACSSYDILKGYYNLRYKEENGKLTRVLIENDPFYLIKSTHTAMHLQSLFVSKFLLHDDDNENCFDFAIKHFTESRKEMQKHWKTQKYTIIIYRRFKKDRIFCKKLQDAGFNVIYIPGLQILDSSDMTHHFPDYHPKESAWDIITPKIAEILNL